MEKGGFIRQALNLPDLRGHQLERAKVKTATGDFSVLIDQIWHADMVDARHFMDDIQDLRAAINGFPRGKRKRSSSPAGKSE
jgi:hypothetical protein